MGRPACQGALKLPLSERACVAPLSAKARPLNLRSRLFAVGQDIKCIHGTAHRTSREDRSEGPIDRPCRSGPRKPTPEPRPACGPTYSARGTPELEHDSVTCTPYKSSKTARWPSGTLKLAVGLPSPRYSAPVLFKGRPRFPACPSFVNVALVPFRVLGVRQWRVIVCRGLHVLVVVTVASLYKGHVGPAQWKGGDWAGSKKRK